MTLYDRDIASSILGRVENFQKTSITAQIGITSQCLVGAISVLLVYIPRLSDRPSLEARYGSETSFIGSHHVM